MKHRILAAVIGTVMDFELAEDALRASEERYRNLFESSRDALMSLEPPFWRFTAGNRAAVEMFGAKNGETLLIVVSLIR